MLSRGWGGGERNAFDMAVHLAETEGVELCFAAREGSAVADRLRGAGTAVQLATVPHRGAWDWRTSRALLALCRRFKPDIVHTHFNRASTIAGKLTGSFEAGYVASLHGKYGPKNYRRIGHIIVATQALADYVAKKFEPEVVIHRLPLAVTAPDGPAVRKPHDGFVVGAIGRLHTVKGYDFLLDAFARLREREPGRDVRLVVAGAGTELEALKKQTVALNIDAYVTFPGWIENPAEFFPWIDLLVVPSRSESFGLTILEAAPFGLPVIATETDGPRELLHPDQLVPFGAIDRLAEKMAAATVDPGLFPVPESPKMENYIRELIGIYNGMTQSPPEG